MLRRTKKPQRPSNPVVYPVGSAVESDGNYYYIKSSSIRMRVPSKRILDSWKFHRVIPSNELGLKNYKIMGKLGFRSGSLIHNVADGRMYLVSENKLRHIQSPEALVLIGAVYNEAVNVSESEISLHELGLPLA